jgi:ketosteroid isomerase-like protein
LVTDDVVIMHPNGRTDVGKAAVRADFERFFRQFTVDQKVVSDETVVSGEWAFDRGRVHTTVMPVGGGNPVQIASEVVTLLRREANGAWKVARAIGVLR